MGVVITGYTGDVLDLEGGKPFELCFWARVWLWIVHNSLLGDTWVMVCTVIWYVQILAWCECDISMWALYIGYYTMGFG